MGKKFPAFTGGESILRKMYFRKQSNRLAVWATAVFGVFIRTDLSGLVVQIFALHRIIEYFLGKYLLFSVLILYN